jgi:hypothetical protein
MATKRADHRGEIEGLRGQDVASAVTADEFGGPRELNQQMKKLVLVVHLCALSRPSRARARLGWQRPWRRTRSDAPWPTAVPPRPVEPIHRLGRSGEERSSAGSLPGRYRPIVICQDPLRPEPPDSAHLNDIEADDDTAMNRIGALIGVDRAVSLLGVKAGGDNVT